MFYQLEALDGSKIAQLSHEQYDCAFQFAILVSCVVCNNVIFCVDFS